MSFQLKTSYSIKFFHETFKKKIGAVDYARRDTKSPAIFFGLYHDSDWRHLREHRGFKIAWFAGTDSWMALQRFRKGENDFKDCLKDAVVVAESHWIAEDLDEMGIKYERISLLNDSLDKWNPVPLGNALFFYNANTSRYGKEYLPAIRNAFPDMEIITNDAHAVPHDEMPNIYAKCFAGFRPITHDGISQSTSEMGLMGRITIWGEDTPFSRPFINIEDAIKRIRILREGYNHRLIAKRARMWFIENEIKFTDLILKFTGTAHLDSANIFYEDPKRSGSFFRIQRKEDIEKIGGFGQDQFERKFFGEKMRELGRKQLITSKNSGFVVSEFKNSDSKKGYPEGVDFLTRDRGTI